jgi:hypothetical protein
VSINIATYRDTIDLYWLVFKKGDAHEVYSGGWINTGNSRLCYRLLIYVANTICVIAAQRRDRDTTAEVQRYSTINRAKV